SLIPGLSRRMAAELNALGVKTWQDILAMDLDRWQQLNLTSSESSRWKRAARQVHKSRLALRASLESNAFREWTLVGMDYVQDGEQLSPQRIWHEVGGAVCDTGLGAADLEPLVKKRALAFYGEIDHRHFLHVARQVLPDARPSCVNVVA